MSFTVVSLIYALAFGLIVGVFMLMGFNSQHKGSAALEALKQRMGPLYSVCLILSGALPMMAVGLLASGLKGAPTTTDVILLVVLIGAGLLASLTLLGNVMGVLGERAPSGKNV